MPTGEESEKLWVYMTRFPPGSWESDHKELLIDYARRTARSVGADEHQADDAGLEVAYKIMKCNWWSKPGPNAGNPQGFKSYIGVAVRYEIIDQYRKRRPVEQREVSIEGSRVPRQASDAEWLQLEPVESRPDFNPEAALVHNQIAPDTINEIYQVLSDFIGILRDEGLETCLFLIHFTGGSADPSNFDDSSDHLLAEFIGILSGSVRPKDFVEAMMDANPQLNRNQARKRVQRVQTAFRPFKEELRVLF